MRKIKVKILEQEYKELEDAVDYYEEEQNGLGLRMIGEVDSRSKVYSEATNNSSDSRGRVLPSESQNISVLAIAHGYREPGSWMKRKIEIS